MHCRDIHGNVGIYKVLGEMTDTALFGFRT